jgi:hypothetical protein
MDGDELDAPKVPMLKQARTLKDIFLSDNLQNQQAGRQPGGNRRAISIGSSMPGSLD